MAQKKLAAEAKSLNEEKRFVNDMKVEPNYRVCFRFLSVGFDVCGVI